MRTATISEDRDTRQGVEAGATGGEFLTFRLGAEEYGIEILKVQEIRGYDLVTHIANAPDYIKGVINLRGAIVPIVDMRIKLHVGEARYDPFTVVIVLDVSGSVVGIVVDSVSDVVALTPGQIRPAPEFQAAMDTGYVKGLGALDGRMLILVEIEKVVLGECMGLIAPQAE